MYGSTVGLGEHPCEGLALVHLLSTSPHPCFQGKGVIWGGLSSQSNGHGRAGVLGVPHADMGWPQREGRRSLIGEAQLGPAIQSGEGRGQALVGTYLVLSLPVQGLF